MPTAADPQVPLGPLQRRLATAAVLIPLVVAAVLWLPAVPFAVFAGTIVCWAAWEWSALAGLSAVRSRALYVLGIGAGLGLWWLAVPRAWDDVVLAAGVLWWLLVAVVLLRRPDVAPRAGVEPLQLLVGVCVLLPPWVALNRLHGSDTGPWLVLALLMLVWVADSAAYFAGRRFGRRKLAPALSPGKTWAGVYGALVGAALWGLVLVLLLRWPDARAPALVGLCALTAAASIAGDLFESLHKRRRGLKDTGRVLPGHGGVLDRIDSTTAAAPIFALGLALLQGVS